MGDHAHDAVLYAMLEEDYLDEHLPNGRLPHPLFDSAIHTIESLQAQTNDLLGLLHGSSGRFLLVGEATVRSEPDIQSWAKKHERAWTMKVGMAKQFLKTGWLSEMQMAWMQTNWKDGAQGFHRDLTGSEKDKILDDLIMVSERITCFAQGNET